MILINNTFRTICGKFEVGCNPSLVVYVSRSCLLEIRGRQHRIHFHLCRLDNRQDIPHSKLAMSTKYNQFGIVEGTFSVFHVTFNVLLSTKIAHAPQSVNLADIFSDKT